MNIPIRVKTGFFAQCGMLWFCLVILDSMETLVEIHPDHLALPALWTVRLGAPREGSWPLHPSVLGWGGEVSSYKSLCFPSHLNLGLVSKPAGQVAEAREALGRQQRDGRVWALRGDGAPLHPSARLRPGLWGGRPAGLLRTLAPG